MGWCIIKTDPKKDFYVVWSSITESPLGWGTRDETMDMLLEMDQRKPQYAQPDWERAFERVEEKGSSSHLGYDWDDEDGPIFEQRGVLPRAKIEAFVNSYDPETSRYDLSLLESFGDIAVRTYEVTDLMRRNLTEEVEVDGYSIPMPKGAVLCPVCGGLGRRDSCFDCGNRGWVPPGE